MSGATTANKGGLEGVVAADSAVCFIDGNEGVLIYRGINIHELAERATFEEVAFLLWNGRLPGQSELAELNRQFSRSRALSAGVEQILRNSPSHVHPMALLRTAVSAAGLADPEAEDSSDDANRRKAVRLTAQMAAIVAAIDRIRTGKSLVEPRSDLSHAGNFLWMLTGKEPGAFATRVMDVALILHADHGFNASTFAARITVSTLSDLYSGIVSALGALKGRLHGGANEGVMRMLTEIGSVDRVDGYVHNAIAAKQRVMGFGHRVYRTEDPRATHLRRLSEQLGTSAGKPEMFEMSRRIEEIMISTKGLNANVDFYSASTYHCLGIPTDLFTPVFAVSRISGWTAHIFEQLADNRLIRPKENYTGPFGLHYVPIAQR